MPSAAPAPAILVVDDHDLLRLGVRTLVQAQGGPAVVLEAGSLADGLALYGREAGRIGWVLLDLNLPDSQGLAGLRAFRERYPGARVAVLSGHMDAALADEAIAQGAAACFGKSGDIAGMARYLFPQAAGGADAVQPVLTPRQRQMLDAVLDGLPNRAIAEAAHLSEGTVKNHVSALLLRFGVRSRAQLIAALSR